MVAGMIGFMAMADDLRSVPARTTRVQRQRQSAAKPVTAARFFAPLTDADVARVSALPAQAQAEELLERAIGHDTHALELFDRQVESWIGQIRMSDRCGN